VAVSLAAPTTKTSRKICSFANFSEKFVRILQRTNSQEFLFVFNDYQTLAAAPRSMDAA
jgi:hypothetical protein